MKNKTIIRKIFSYLIVFTIFFFLGKGLIENWQKLKEYNFSFNYFYLISSFVFLIPGIVLLGFIWNAILRSLEPNKKLPFLKALWFFVCGWLYRYLPGAVWMYLARIYLGAKEGLSKKTLTLSVFYEAALAIASAFLLSIFLLGLVFGSKFLGLVPDFYILFPVLAMGAGLVFIHPKIFNFFLNLFLKRIKKTELLTGDFLSYSAVLKIILYYFISYILIGAGFFFLVRSLAYLPFYDILGAIGIYILASVLGTLAVFAPSGLGVREAFLAIFLQLYFPLSIATLIALLARVWTTLGEITIFMGLYSFMNKKDFFRVLAHFIFRIRQFNNRCLKNLAGDIRNKRILEIGSGQGDYYSAKHFFDSSNEFIQSDIVEGYGHKIIDVVQMNYKNEFDIILSLSVLEHIFDIHQAIENIYRALRPDGLAVFFVPGFYPLHGESNDYWRFTEHSLKRLLKKFKRIKIKHSGLKQFPFAYYIEAVK